MKAVYKVHVSFITPKLKQHVNRTYLVAKKEDIVDVHEGLKGFAKELSMSFAVDHIMTVDEIVKELKDHHEKR